MLNWMENTADDTPVELEVLQRSFGIFANIDEISQTALSIE